MTEEAAGLGASRSQSWIAGLALAGAVVIAAVGIPDRIGPALDALSRMRQHDSWSVGSRAVLGQGLHDALVAADTLLPDDAVVLLVTSGRDWRRKEYFAFHRALYVLAPRPVWWAMPARPDESWESHWWLEMAPTLDATTRRARETGASHVLALAGAGWQLPGTSVIELPGGARLSTVKSLSGTARAPGRWRAAPSPERAAPALAVLLLAGWVLSQILIPREEHRSPLVRLALFWLLGSGAVSVAMFWMTWLGMSPRFQRVSVLALVLASAMWIVRAHGTAKFMREPLQRLRSSWLTRRALLHRHTQARINTFVCGALVLWLIAELGGVLLRSMSGPLSGWDGWVTWAMKARVLYTQHDSAALLLDASREISNRSYPLLLPLTEAWVYGWVGGADDRFAAIVTWCFLSALLVLLVSALRSRLPCIFALGMTVVFLATPYAGFVTSLGYADVVLAAYALAAALALRRLEDTAGAAPVALAASLLGLLPWIKPEGIILAFALLFAALATTRSISLRRRLAGAAALAMAICAGPWYLLVATAHLSNPGFAWPPIVSPGRISDVVTGLLARAAHSEWHGIWLVSAVALAVVIARGRWRSLLPIAICVYLACLVLVFLFSRYDPLAQHVLRSGDRLLLHVAPLALILIADLPGRSTASGPRAST